MRSDRPYNGNRTPYDRPRNDRAGPPSHRFASLLLDAFNYFTFSRARTVKEAIETNTLLTKEQYLSMDDVSLSGESEEMKTQAFEAYKEKHRRTALERFFLGHKDEVWFSERYLGDEFENESIEIKKGLGKFLEDFEAGKMEALNLEFSNDLVPTEESGPQKSLPVSMSLPEAITGAAIERFGDILALGNIPPNVKRGSLESLLRDSDDGFLQLFLEEPVYEKSLYRSGFALFKESTDLAALAFKLDTVLVDGSKVYYSVHKSFTRQLSSVSSEFSTPERIAKDRAMSERLLASLLTRFAVGQDIPWRSLEDDRKALDLNLACLRRVFNLCYYSGQRFENPIGLQKALGDFVLRAPLGSSEAVLQGPSPTALDSKIEDLARLYGPSFEHATEDNIIESKYVISLDEGRSRCSICSKLFKGSEFVIKHVHFKHEEEAKTALQQLTVLNLFLSRPAPCAFLRSSTPRRPSVSHGGYSSAPRARPYDRPAPPDADTKPLRRRMNQYNDWDAPAAGEVEISYD